MVYTFIKDIPLWLRITLPCPPTKKKKKQNSRTKKANSIPVPQQSWKSLVPIVMIHQLSFIVFEKNIKDETRLE